MKAIPLIFAVSAAFLFSTSGEAAVSDAKAKELLGKYGCQACHAVDKKIVGPAFKDVASKYANDKSAREKLEKKIQTGGSGVWGTVPMPPTNVPDADRAALVEWVLGLK